MPGEHIKRHNTTQGMGDKMYPSLTVEVWVVAAPQSVYAIRFSNECGDHLGLVVRHVERYVEHDAIRIFEVSDCGKAKEEG